MSDRLPTIFNSSISTRVVSFSLSQEVNIPRTGSDGVGTHPLSVYTFENMSAIFAMIVSNRQLTSSHAYMTVMENCSARQFMTMSMNIPICASAMMTFRMPY